MRKIEKPEAGEYNPYAIMYLKLLPDDGNVLQHLVENFKLSKDLIYALPAEKLNYRYAEGKWTIREVLVHIMDDERIYAYRALRIARNDKTELPGFEQDEYVPYSRANERSLDDIFHEYATVRASTISLFNSFDDAALLRLAVAAGHPVSVRALAWHIAGHELHHLNIIREYYL